MADTLSNRVRLGVRLRTIGGFGLSYPGGHRGGQSLAVFLDWLRGKRGKYLRIAGERAKETEAVVAGSNAVMCDGERARKQKLASTVRKEVY